MNPIELLKSLEGKGISLTISGDRLKVDAPIGALTSELREAIVVHKTSLMALMSQHHSDTSQSLARLVAVNPTLPTFANIAACRAERDQLAVDEGRGLSRCADPTNGTGHARV